MDSFTVAASFILFCISVTILFILSFTQKRSKLSLDTCGGFPGIVPPINYLEPKHRLVYVLACGLLASPLLSVIISHGNIDLDNRWAEVIVHNIYIVFFIVLFVINTYPILACVQAPIPILGYALGAMYTDINFLFNIVIFGLSIHSYSVLPIDKSMKQFQYCLLTVTLLPQLFCLIGVIVWYHYKLIKEILQICRAGNSQMQAISQQPDTENHISYVRQLLQKNPTIVKKYYFTGLHLPLPVLIAGVVAAIMIFQLTVIFCFIAPFIVGRSSPLFQVISAASIISPILSFIFSCALFAHFIYSMKKNIKDHRKEQSEMSRKPIKWPAVTLSSSVRYAGYQVAAIFTAWIVHTAIIFAILMIILLPRVFGYFLYYILATVWWILLVLVIQMACCKLFFTTDDSAILRTVIIDNRRLFNLFSYTVFLYNIVTGAMAAVIRLLLSFFVMIIILPRMDRLMFVKGFEKIDIGHAIFNNFMVMESLLHNPIVHTFVHILRNKSRIHHDFKSPLASTPINKYGAFTVADKQGLLGGIEGHYNGPYRVSRRAHNRWFVAYTLIKNPSLRKAQDECY